MPALEGAVALVVGALHPHHCACPARMNKERARDEDRGGGPLTRVKTPLRVNGVPSCRSAHRNCLLVPEHRVGDRAVTVSLCALRYPAERVGDCCFATISATRV